MRGTVIIPTISRIFLIIPLALLFLLMPGQARLEAASVFDNWHGRQCPLTNASLTTITYGNGRFVTFADSLNRVLTSTNGIDWEVHPAPYPNLRTIIFGNNLFLASFIPPLASQPQRIYSSPDGVAWTLRFIAPDSDETDIRALEAGNNKFVAVGKSIWISSDLTNWSASAYGTVSFTDVAFLNGTFVASDASALWMSPDANGWTYRASSFGGAKVAAGNGKFCTVGYPSGRTSVSADGVTWTLAPAMNVPSPFMLGPLTFAGGSFIALGSTSTSNLLTSTNGQDWELHSFGTNFTANGIAFGNNTFVAVGNGNVILQSDSVTSPGAPRPTLAITQVPIVTITGEAGRDYQLEYSDALGGTNTFHPLTVIHLETSQGTWVDTTATNSARRFYRALVMP